MNERAQHAAWRLCCAGLGVNRGGRAVLSDVNLELSAGDCLTLIGPNGSGKTTLLLALLGLLRPSRGTALLDGTPVHLVPPPLRARWAACVPQGLVAVPPFAVRDVVATGRYPHLGPLQPLGPADQAVVAAALERCGLTALADRLLPALSGGERQKTMLAAAIAQDPQVLFLDEPHTALDPAYQIELLRILHAWRASGRGVVLISHDLQLPGALGGRVIALHGGRVVADGPAAEVLRPASLSAVYQAPFTSAVTPAGEQIVLPHWWAPG